MADYYCAPDLDRALTGDAPFSVVPGRGVVDAHGRLILQCVAWRAITRDGRAFEEREGMALQPWEADANAHAIASMLNNPAAYLVQWVEDRVSLESNPTRREWLKRQLGNIRKMASDF